MSVSAAEVRVALSNVIDPEIDLSVVELGLIYDVTIADGRVTVTYSLTTPGCPFGQEIERAIVELVGALPGVREVRADLTFSPLWTTERMSADAKFALGLE